jgi:hypothetical protein
MVKSATEAGSIPTFHYMDEVEVDGLLAARALLKDHPTLGGAQRARVSAGHPAGRGLGAQQRSCLQA